MATLLVWSHARGPRPLRAVARLSLLAASQITAVLFVAAAVNDYGYFYGSWSELFGQRSPVGQPAPAAPRTSVASGGRGTGAGRRMPTTAGPAAVSVVRALPDPGWSTRAPG